MTISTRVPEITIKFKDKLDLPAEGKKATVVLESENGLQMSAEINRKSAAKQLKKVDEYADWIGAIGGKINRIEDGVMYVNEASLQVFEKKPKPPKEEK